MQQVSESAGQRVGERLRVVIAGGGTGGHVVPALAIGRELRDKHGADVLFVGTSRGLESKLVPEAGFRLELVRSGQLKNVSLKTRLKTMGDLPLGVVHCMRLLSEFRPQVVVGVDNAGVQVVSAQYAYGMVGVYEVQFVLQSADTGNNIPFAILMFQNGQAVFGNPSAIPVQ